MTNGHKLNMRKEAKKDMMVKFGKKIVKFRVPILILSILLLIPSALGYLHTRINYDVLTYLPDNIETMKGQDILVNDFGTGAFSMFIVDGMEDKDVSKLKEKIEKVDHVKEVIWYDSIADISMPKSMLPTKVYDAFNSETGTMMAIFFDEGTSSDGTMEASSGWTNIFIYPGYTFKCIDALITNFHLPESTLIMLVSALAGRENVLHAYSVAVEEEYRFFSFGDAMIVE